MWSGHPSERGLCPNGKMAQTWSKKVFLDISHFRRGLSITVDGRVVVDQWPWTLSSGSGSHGQAGVSL